MIKRKDACSRFHREDLTVASSSPACVLLRGGVTLQGLQPCAGHVFNRKLGGRDTGLRTDCNIVVYLGLSLVLYSHPSDVGISVSLDNS